MVVGDGEMDNFKAEYIDTASRAASLVLDFFVKGTVLAMFALISIALVCFIYKWRD